MFFLLYISGKSVRRVLATESQEAFLEGKVNELPSTP
jgi:hypothetical protein